MAGRDFRRASAGEIFGELTRASFQGLRTEFDEDDRPLIVGVRPDGTAVTVDGMSDGTRDQLFLALRLAAIELHVQSAEPLPLVLDDLLVNFDGERATATLRLLLELSNSVPVLFFTHHAHLVELARSIGQDVSLFVHKL